MIKTNIEISEELSIRLENSLKQFNLTLKKALEIEDYKLKTIGFGNKSIIELQTLKYKQKMENDKKFQQKLVDELKTGKLLYENASIYTIILDLVQGNGKEEVFRVFNEVVDENTWEQSKSKALTQEEVMKQRSNAYEFIDFDKQETLEEVAEKYVDSFKYGITHPRRVCKNAFINGAKSDATKEYWYNIFLNKNL